MSVASSSVESTISHASSTSAKTAATASAPAPNDLIGKGKHGPDMKLWCRTFETKTGVAIAPASTASSFMPSTQADSEESSTTAAISPSPSVTTKSDDFHSNFPQLHQQQPQKRYRNYHHSRQQNANSSSRGYPPSFGRCQNTRPSFAFEQLEELMRLCNHEYSSNESYYYSINALLRQIQEIRGSFTPAGGASRVHSADFIAPTLPSAPINRTSSYLLFRRIEVPENPTFNLIGRVLGPRGLTARELESRFQVRVYIRGQGSIRNPEKAKKLMGKPGWEHLTEALHILVISAGNIKVNVETRLQSASEFIIRLLHPRGFDSFKRHQLISLALLNGTFRPQQFQHTDASPEQHQQQPRQNQISVH